MRIVSSIIFGSFFCTFAVADVHIVNASGMSFSPNTINVTAGDTIRWQYISGLNHTVTTGTNCLWDGLFHASLASFNPIVEWIVPEDAPSSIPYFCLPHCDDGMTAQINVSFDCNANGVADNIDIKTGSSQDTNSDGIPDECQCVADVTGDAVVNVSDLLSVIDQWGQPNSPADISGDGIVNVTDLLEVVGSWGPC